MTDSNTATVRYYRRVTRKDVDGNYDSIDLGGEVTRDYGTAVENGKQLVDAWEALFNEFKKTVDAQVESPAVVAEQPKQLEPLSPEPGGWISNQITQNTEMIQKSTASERPRTDEQGTPSADLLPGLAQENVAVQYASCKVFNVENRTLPSGSPLVNLRIGARGPNGIPGQYTTAESFEPSIIESVRDQKIREGDFVNVWGYFKPWKNNPERFNLVLQKIELDKQG